ncbi:MAG: hypothetical protein HY794_03625 [Desulfarculus sp.]|nr:hypothetical protein [Desulfarculus sp.]
MIDIDLACVYLGGLLHLGWAVFHLLFPRLFKWAANLASLDPVNQGIMRIMNFCLAYYFLAAAFLSFYWAPELVDSYLGRQVLGLMAGFWLLRLGLQFSYFKASHPLSLVLSLLFLLSAAAYAFPLWYGA